MAEIRITIPNDVAARVIDAVCAVYEYPAQVRDDAGELIANPQSKQTFAKNHIKDHLMDIVRRHESRQAAAAASATAIAKANAEITIT